MKPQVHRASVPSPERGRDEAYKASQARLPPYLAAVPRVIRPMKVAAPGTELEHEADRMARRFSQGVGLQALREPVPGRGAPARSPIASVLSSDGRMLDESIRRQMEGRFGMDLGHVRVHTGAQAESLNDDLGSRAFTQGRDIFFGKGQTPGANAVTAHEIAHVVQQSGGSMRSALGPVTPVQADGTIQRDLNGTYAAGKNGCFEVSLWTRHEAGFPLSKSGLDGVIRFVPIAGAPNSNDIFITQIARVDQGGKDGLPVSVPPEQGQRGSLGDSGLLTADDPKRGVKGGYGIDAPHAEMEAAGTDRAPHYGAQPGEKEPLPGASARPKPNSADHLVQKQRRGFKRSDDPADIRSASIIDFPGTTATDDPLTQFSFETVVRGDDTMFVYGALAWGFSVSMGRVFGEHLSVKAAQSATFDEALQRHQDFYATMDQYEGPGLHFHQDASFYFDFGSDALPPKEGDKIESFRAFMERNPEVDVCVFGYADVKEEEQTDSLELSWLRAEATASELMARRIEPIRIRGVVGYGATASGTPDAGKGDQGGDKEQAKDPSREANRWPNRRAVVTFINQAKPGREPEPVWEGRPK